MRILVPAPILEPVGGVEVSTVQYAAELARRGHELTVVYCQDGTQRPAYEAMGAHLVEVPGFWVHQTAPRDAGRFLAAARRVARAARPDVVYLNRMEHIVWGQTAARSARAGLVLHLHGVWRPIPAPLRRGISHYVAVSESVRQQWLDLDIPPDLISVVHQHVSARDYPPGGLPEQRIARQAVGLPDGPRVVLYYGRLDADKGVSDIFAAWRALGLEGSRAVLAVMPSTVDPQLIADTKAAAPEGTLWLERRVDVVPVLHAADLVVMPSHWDEPFGRVVIEAMSSGRPALASAVGGVPEVLSGPMSRFLFPRGDIAALQALISDTIDWRDREPALENECIDWVRTRFDLPDKVDAVEGFLCAAAQPAQRRPTGAPTGRNGATGSVRHEISEVGGEFRPIHCLDLELTDPSASGPIDSEPALALLRVHGAPVAQLLLEEGLKLVELLGRLSSEARSGLVGHLVTDGHATADPASDEELAALVLSAGTTCPRDDAELPSLPVSVIVCTLGHEPLLRACLERLRDQDHTAFDIVVVDNDPASGAVAALLADLANDVFHYVAQPLKGLSHARNAGLEATRHDVVAFTDDDAIADRDWVRRIATVFARDQVVSAVTGLVVPWELQTQAQLWFEQFGSFDRGCHLRVWAYPQSRRFESLGPQGKGGPSYPFSVGAIGSGNNMAFRRDRVRALGAFDTALGAGTIAGGGEDLDIFLRLLLAGDVIVYEPQAVVRHRHRRETAALRSQTWFYGAGLTAMLTKTLVTRPSVLWDFARRVPAGVRHMVAPTSEKNAGRGSNFPAELTMSERRGFAAGPCLYLRSRWMGHKS